MTPATLAQAVMEFDPEAPLDDPPVCHVCGSMYTMTEPDYDPTLTCDACAHSGLYQVSEALLAAKHEISELRTALIDVCDAYTSMYDMRAFVRRMRAAANRTNQPFDFEKAKQ